MNLDAKKPHVSVWKQQVGSVSSCSVVCVLNEVESGHLCGGGKCWESNLEESTDLKQQCRGGWKRGLTRGTERLGMSFLFLSNI